MIQTTYVPQGWECPKCKRVYSPTTIMCSYCQGVVTTGSTTTFTSSGSTNYSMHKFEQKESTSATVCKICGLEKWQHPQFSYT